MRTRGQIDQEYGVVAQVYGDRVARGTMIQKEIGQLHERMMQLLSEKASDDPKPVPLPVPPLPNMPAPSPVPPSESEKVAAQAEPVNA